MNSNFSQLPPEECELRLTALLLGELPPAEADQVRAALAADPELAREHERLRQTIELVRETAAMDRKTSADGTPLRLDDKRREQLLATFKTPAPRAVVPRRPRNLWYVPLSIAAVLVGLLAVASMLPMLAKGKARAERLTPLPSLGQVNLFADEYDSKSFNENLQARSARPEVEILRRQVDAVPLADNFDVSGFIAQPAAESRPQAASKPGSAFALAMPARTDTDGDSRLPVSGQVRSLSDFSEEQLLTKGLQDESKRPSVVRALTRADDYALASGGSIDVTKSAANPVPDYGASSQLSVPTITTTSGRQVTTPVLGVNFAIRDLETSSTVPQAGDPAVLAKNLDLGETKMLGSLAAGIAPAPSSPPFATPVPPAGSVSPDLAVRSANVASLYADVAPESELKQKARFESDELAGGVGSFTFRKRLYDQTENNLSQPSLPAANAPKQEMTVAEAEPIIEARRLQLSATGPATPGILPPTALGLELKAAEQAQTATKSYAEETRWWEAKGQQPLTEADHLLEKSVAFTTPPADNFFFKLNQSGAENLALAAQGGSATRGGLVGGRGVDGTSVGSDSPVAAYSFGQSQNRGSGRGGGGGSSAGVSIAPGGSRDRFGGIDAVSDGLAVTPPPPVSASAGLGNVTAFSTAAQALIPNPVNQPAQYRFELAANPTPVPEGMVDALEAIRKTPSNAGGAGVSSRGDSPNNFFRSRMLLEPSSGGRVSVTRSPAPAPVKEAVRFADDGAALFVNGATVASTNALVSNHYWGMNAIHSAADQGSAWFGNTAQDNVQWDFFAPIADGEKTAPSEGRFKTTGDSSGLNRGWVSADAGIAKEQPVGGVDGRLGGSGPRTSRRMNSVVNRAGEVVVSDPVANTSPMTREFFADDFDVVPTSERGRAAGDVNGRVTVQLPALAGEAQLSRQSSPTRPAGGRQSELASEVGAVVAKPAPANVTMTGITTLSGEMVAKLEMKENEMKEELNQRQSVRDKLKLNIDATEIELSMPKLSSVEIMEAADADAPAKPSFWGRVAGAFSSEVQRGARISVEQDMPDVDATGRGLMAGYRPTPDPFFTQTELERIQSKPVLGKVVEKLKLDEEWAKKSGAKLSQDEAVALLKKKLDVRQDAKTTLIDIRAKSESAEEAARLANAVAQAYADTRKERHQGLVSNGVVTLRKQLAEKDKQVANAKQQLEQRLQERVSEREETNRPKPSAASPTPQPEVLTRDNAFSTFSLNVSDVSFKLAAASLEKGAMPDVATVRSEEFINAFDYRDPVPLAGVPLGFVSERARYPFAHNRDVLRFSVKTAAQGRDGGRPLNIVLLLDNSGSMERADRVQIIQEALRALAAQLQPQDKLSVVTFSRTARLWADGVTGAQAAQVANKIAALTPEGGTNLEEALDLAYRTALRHYAATAMNRVVLLTDGAANLGNVEPAALKAKVESFRKQGVALDCFGIGWEGFNDDLLENLSRNGDGRYGFVNTPEEASTEFAAQLAGALQVAASDVKVQVEFNPKRVTAYRQIGYAKHQLTKQQFRDNTVDAAEISASEAGNALYVIETNPRGEGPIATVRARFRIPQTSDYREHEWVVPFGSAVELEQSSSALRLATSASAFSEWLAGSPFAGEVTTDRLLGLLSGVPEVYGADPRPKKLEWMIRQAKSISGK